MASSVSWQDESNPALWLATRAGKMELSCPPGTTRRVPQEKIPRKPYNKSFIDQACSVKMTGYWPRSFFACLWTSTPSRSINTKKKKNLANIQPSWPHTWSITHKSCPRTHRPLDSESSALTTAPTGVELYFNMCTCGSSFTCWARALSCHIYYFSLNVCSQLYHQQQ